MSHWTSPDNRTVTILKSKMGEIETEFNCLGGPAKPHDVLCRVPLPAFLNIGPSSRALGPNLLSISRHETAQLARAAIMRGYLNLEPLDLQRQFLCAVGDHWSRKKRNK